MAVNWMDVSSLSFNTLLLLERVQLSWFPGWVPEEELAIALQANPAVDWYMSHKCPQLEDWLHTVRARVADQEHSPEVTRQAEETVMRAINDLLVYVVDPKIYDAQPFLGWDSAELTAVEDFSGKTVVDVGAGTGRLTLIAAETAQAVFAVEPVANLRHYLKQKARNIGLHNVFTLDGLITDLPFPGGFAQVTMGGHVFGDDPEDEYREMRRVTEKGGMMILCPGNDDRDNERHQFLIEKGFEWSPFEEPVDGMKRKYWKRK